MICLEQIPTCQLHAVFQWQSSQGWMQEKQMNKSTQMSLCQPAYRVQIGTAKWPIFHALCVMHSYFIVQLRCHSCISVKTGSQALALVHKLGHIVGNVGQVMSWLHSCHEMLPVTSILSFGMAGGVSFCHLPFIYHWCLRKNLSTTIVVSSRDMDHASSR